jgi:large subunit ribosomal protein L21
MYALIETGGHQVRVSEGDIVEVDLTTGNPGDTIQFERVLLVSNDDGVRIGTPTLEGASVSAEVIGEVKGEKIFAFKMKRRQNYRRKVGFRARYTQVKITGITA